MNYQDAEAEVKSRLKRDLQKAVMKYGDKALEPEGDPTRDIFDYAINELCGLIRYGQMMINIVDRLEKEDSLNRPIYTLIRLHASNISHIGKSNAINLILDRQTLKDIGVVLGRPEHSE